MPSLPRPARAALGGPALVSAEARRASARRAVLKVTLSAKPGQRVVRSPASEVWIEPTPFVDSVSGPRWIGDPFTGRDTRDMTYLDGPATTQVALLLADADVSRPLAVSGWVMARACDEEQNICTAGRIPFTATVPAFNGWHGAA